MFLDKSEWLPEITTSSANCSGHPLSTHSGITASEASCQPTCNTRVALCGGAPRGRVLEARVSLATRGGHAGSRRGWGVQSIIGIRRKSPMWARYCGVSWGLREALDQSHASRNGESGRTDNLFWSQRADRTCYAQRSWGKGVFMWQPGLCLEAQDAWWCQVLIF